VRGAVQQTEGHRFELKKRLIGMAAKDERMDTVRLSIFKGAALLFLIGLMIRLLQVQVVQREYFLMLAGGQFKEIVKLAPERGTIYDRNLTALTVNVPTVIVTADPSIVTHPESVAYKLSKILGKSPKYYLAKLRLNENSVILEKNAPKSVEKAIDALNIPGIYCRVKMVREYPKQQTASQIVGFTGSDGEGLSGAELFFDAFLKGLPGKAVLQKTARGNYHLFRRPEYPWRPAEKGKDVVLTINYVYQSIAEEELHKTILETDADSGTVVILDSATGDVLAMASEPGFNPNHYGRYHPSTWRIRAITDIFEPGSGFKLVLLSAVLNEQLRKPEDLVFCENGAFSVMGETIHDTSPHGWMTLRDVVVKSSNIGMAKTSMEVDRGLFYRYARDFGFGVKSGIELGGEVSGILKPTIQWSGFTRLAMAYGHEVAVTPLQMCNMFNTIANGGLLLQPHILKEIRDHKNGKVLERTERKIIRRVISRSTAETIKSIMHEVVTRGTAKTANMAEVEVCGKTGTARMVRPGKRGYQPHEYIASFGGFFPKDNPKLTMFIMVENPKRGYYGGRVAAPCFRRIAEEIIAYEGIDHFKDNANGLDFVLEDRETKKAPQVLGCNVKVAEKLAEESDVTAELVGHGEIVVEQKPKPGKDMKESEKMTLKTNDPAVMQVQGQKVPSVIGLPIRNALNILTSKGIKVVVDGTGRVVRQQPPPGEFIKDQEQVLLHCESSIDLRKLLIL